MSILLLIVINLFISKTGFAAKDTSFVTLTILNKIDGKKLELGKEFTNPFNEPFTVTRLKYYLSNFTFYKADGARVNIPNSYFLINEEDPGSKSLTLSIKAGNYNQVSFLIGVDSIRNVSGTQTDALDPMNGMFWTWNSGYIMAKLEATSPLSKSPNKLVEYHIGGFRTSQSTVRRITLSFPSKEVLSVRDGSHPNITIEADINNWFRGQHHLKIAEHTACTTPGDLAVKYADNYADMFRIAPMKYSAVK